MLAVGLGLGVAMLAALGGGALVYTRYARDARTVTPHAPPTTLASVATSAPAAAPTIAPEAPVPGPAPAVLAAASPTTVAAPAPEPASAPAIAPTAVEPAAPPIAVAPPTPIAPPTVAQPATTAVVLPATVPDEEPPAAHERRHRHGRHVPQEDLASSGPTRIEPAPPMRVVTTPTPRTVAPDPDALDLGNPYRH